MTRVANLEAPLPGKVIALLAEVKALPSADQEAFAKLFHDWKSTNEHRSAIEDRQEETPIQWPDFAGRMKEIFPNGPIPGDPQKFWDEMRREE